MWLIVILFWFAGMSAAFVAFPTQRLVEAAIESGRLDPNFDRWDECKRAPLKVIVAATTGWLVFYDCPKSELNASIKTNHHSQITVLTLFMSEFPSCLYFSTDGQRDLNDGQVAFCSVLRLIFNCVAPISPLLRIYLSQIYWEVCFFEI
jgi:hypothetical protein